MKNIKGVMFDMGGTLIEDYNLSFDNGFSQVYEHFKYKRIDKTKFLDLCHELLKDTLYNRLTFDIKCVDLMKFIIDYLDEEFDCSLDEIEKYFSIGFSETLEIEGIRNILEYYKSIGLKLIVLSNTFLSSKEIRRRLDTVDLSKYFDNIIASSDYLLRKPSKFFFEYGIKEMGLNKDEVIYVGNDYKFDCVGSNNANIDIIFYNKLHYKEYNFDNLNIKVKEIKNYNEIEGLEPWQIF